MASSNQYIEFNLTQCISEIITYSTLALINNTNLTFLDLNLKSASNLNGNLNCSKELEHYAS